MYTRTPINILGYLHSSRDINMETGESMKTYTYTLQCKCCSNIKSNKAHAKHRPQRPACGRWTFYVLRQRPGWGRDKTRERAKLQAKYCMFDLTKRYFQNRIQKFQPSGHNYLFSKLRFSSFAILPVSCDTDTTRASVRVIYWLAVCCYVVGAERKGRRSTSRAERQASSQVARQATRINTHSLSCECSR